VLLSEYNNEKIAFRHRDAGFAKKRRGARRSAHINTCRKHNINRQWNV